MTSTTDLKEKRPSAIRDLFGRIALRYDLMNRLMTAGQDTRWRQEVIRRAHLRPGASLLDLGTGTGDLSFEALRQEPQSRPTAADFTLEMMREGQKRGVLPWLGADALRLPFRDRTFDSVVSGFLMRNVHDVQQSLREQLRILKPGGHIVVLDTTQPKRNLLSPFVWFHFHVALPTLGRLIAGQAAAYSYLSQSTEGFLRAEQLAAHMAAAGFRQIGFQRRMFGTIAIHWGQK
jgi:demethylmenaquinone methyltransferase/2-methoxy-6-polyprenyl-1,4-benzoquinol methylase